MWLEKPPYFTCRNKTNSNYSYLKLSFSQSYKFISIHPLSHNGHVSQSESHGTTPMAVTGSAFPSSCSNFLSFTLNFGPHLWATSTMFLEATLFRSAFHCNMNKNMKEWRVKIFQDHRGHFASGCGFSQHIYQQWGHPTTYPEISPFSMKRGKAFYYSLSIRDCFWVPAPRRTGWAAVLKEKLTKCLLKVCTDLSQAVLFSYPVLWCCLQSSVP